MSVIIKTSEMAYRDSLGNYHGINAIAEKKIADQIADLDEAIAEQEERIEDDLEQMSADIQTGEDRIDAAVAQMYSDVDSIEDQRQTMIAAIASVAGQGTDTTLTQYGVAADAEAVGLALDDAVNEIEAEIRGRTGANIPLNGNPGATSIEQAIAGGAGILLNVTENTLEAIGEVTDASTDVRNFKIGNKVLPVMDDGAVRSVNNISPDPVTKDVPITMVNAAKQIYSDNAQLVKGEFIRRMSGGTRSIDDGSAYLEIICGRCTHVGYVPDSFSVEITSGETTPIEASVTNSAAFWEKAGLSGTYTFTYNGSWDEDPSEWGITVIGTPANNDLIVVSCEKGDRGTIIPSSPGSFFVSNWNFYNHLTGYARVLKYSDQYGYGISGTYTELKFSTSISGQQTTIIPVNGIFQVPSDGYVFVTGGNSTDTAIWAQHSDWTENYDGDWEAHSETSIDLGEVMLDYFPNGLCSVGSVSDEINLNTQEAIVRIERIDYSAENLAEVINAGRAYDADELYIYAVYADEDMPDPEDIEVDGYFVANDHGMEWFEDTTVPVYTQIIYGDNLADKLRTDVLTKSQDIADDLVTNDENKVLSAKQGKILNEKLISALTASQVNNPVTWESVVTSANSSALLYKIGNLRMLILAVYINTAISTFTKIGKVSTGNRPLQAFCSVASTVTPSSQDPKIIQLRADGVLRMSKANVSTSEASMYYATLIYMVP